MSENNWTELEIIKLQRQIVIKDIKRKIQKATDDDWNNEWFTTIMQRNFSDLGELNKKMDELYTKVDKELEI